MISRIAVGRKAREFILKVRMKAHQTALSSLEQGGNRFSSHHLAAACSQGPKRDARLLLQSCGTYNVTHHGTSEVDLTDNAISFFP